jgi:hypothetical protein
VSLNHKPIVSQPAWVIPLVLLGLTWVRKRTQRHTYRKAGIGWVQHSWWEMPVTISASKCIYLYSMCGKAGEVQVNSHGSSCIGSRNRAAVVCCYLVQTILTRSVCPVFLARQLCWTLLPLGWVHAYQSRGRLSELCPWQGYVHCVSLPSCKAALLNLAYFLCAAALTSQHKGPWHGLPHVKVSSQTI